MEARLPSEQYRLLVEHAPAMMWRSGLDAQCDYFNAT
jgi:two-component system, OmpR family, sensor histidine kinase VicK